MNYRETDAELPENFNSVQCGKISSLSDDAGVMLDPAIDIELDDINSGQDPTEPLDAPRRFRYMDVNSIQLNRIG